MTNDNIFSLYNKRETIVLGKKPLAIVTEVYKDGLDATHSPMVLIRTHFLGNDVGFAIPKLVLGQNTIKTGDKIDFSIMDSGQNTTVNIRDLGGCFYYLKDINIYPSGVVSLEGFRNLRQPQTRFKPRQS